MIQQPEALRLADALGNLEVTAHGMNVCDKAAAELRRQHEVNTDLLEALQDLLLMLEKAWDYDGDVFGRLHNAAIDAEFKAHDAIAKATGEKK